MTLPLPHLRQRKRLTNWATGAPGLIPKRRRSPSAMTPRCRQLRQRTAITHCGLFTFPSARAATAQLPRKQQLSSGMDRIWALIRGNQPVTHGHALNSQWTFDGGAVLIADQTGCGVAGMSMLEMPCARHSASMIAFITAGQDPIAPASPVTFTPSGLCAQRTLLRLELDCRDLVGSRHGVVHRTRGHELTGIRIIDRVLHQRLADPLCGAAVNLAGEQHRVKCGAEIVDDNVVKDPSFSGCRIDLDLRDMGAIRVSCLWWRERVSRGETIPGIWTLRQRSK
jgi:hypothetical protein